MEKHVKEKEIRICDWSFWNGHDGLTEAVGLAMISTVMAYFVDTN